MHWLSLLSILTTAALGLTSPLVPRWDEMRVKHSWHSVPEKWEHLGPPPDGAKIDLRIALKPHHENALIDALYEVSDPEHPKYGEHLSNEQVAELVAPHPETLEVVGSWLAYHEVPSSSVKITHGGGWITLSRVSISQANNLLGASYQLYRHMETNETIIRTIGYVLPAVLHEHVETVAPTTYFGTPRALAQTSQVVSGGPTLPNGDLELQTAAASGHRIPVPPSCSETITPTCLRLLYKTDQYKPSSTTNKLGIAGYLKQNASHADLKEFNTLYRRDAIQASFSVVTLNGGFNDESAPSGEGNLDVQYGGAISYPIKNVYYLTGGSPPYVADDNTPTNTNEPYLEWLDFILSKPNSQIPQTISTSYGDDEQTVPEEYARCVCRLFAQLGAKGVSLLFASGDFGVGPGSCRTNDGTNTVKYIPGFPATCPFVTAVGGTTHVNPEVAVNFSGGGFSNYFERPRYQDAAVSAYLDTIGSANARLYNRSGRGYPDICAQAKNFQVVIDRVVIPLEGTSCASPTAAGVISLLNDHLISKQKPPLGFLNPLIYSKAYAAFNDITSGSNPGCNSAGFTATEGWDPVTGFGTPDFEKLKCLVE